VITGLLGCEKPDRALGTINGLLLRALTNKHGNNAEAMRPDVNKVCRDLRREVRNLANYC
jgi:hypothetical protein